MATPWDIERALRSVVGKITDRDYKQSLACFRFWSNIGQTYCQFPHHPRGPGYPKALSDHILDAIWHNVTATSIDPGCGKLVHPTAHLILRLARDVESDHLLAPHVDGLQARLRTRILLLFFGNNLTLIQGEDDDPNDPKDFCAATNLIAHCVNLGHMEEDAIRDHILQSLITHPNLYNHQADGLIILFKLAGSAFEKYADPSVVNRCFKLLKDYDCRDSTKMELIEVRIPVQ